MKAVVYQAPFSIAAENVPDPELQHPNDGIVKITSSCICGSDLHMYEGRTAAQPGIIFGHENMGVVQEVALPLKGVETDFAADSSGFSTSVYDRWFDHKWGKEKKEARWIKAHIMPA